MSEQIASETKDQLRAELSRVEYELEGLLIEREAYRDDLLMEALQSSGLTEAWLLVHRRGKDQHAKIMNKRREKRRLKKRIARLDK